MDSDDDSDGYRRPSILPVANFDDFDPSKPPASGEEYLRRVQLEAETCPDIVVAQFDVNSFRGQQTEILSNVSSCLLLLELVSESFLSFFLSFLPPDQRIQSSHV